MIYFGNIKFLWMLLLVPVILAGYGIMRWRRRRSLQKLGDPALVSDLMPRYSAVKGWLRCVLVALAMGCMAVGLARPMIGASIREHESAGAEIMICLDVSNSMLAEDYSPSRLDRAKLAITRLVDRLQEDRIGLIVFAGTSFVQLPITTDYISAKMFLSSVDTRSVPVQGTAIGDAITTAIRSFSAQSEKSRAIIVITDGENHEDDPVEQAALAAEQGIKVYTIGVGSTQGQPIPYGGDLLRDSEGNIVVTRLDEETLRRIAAAGGGAYVHAGNEEFGLNPIIEDIQKMEDERFNSIVFEEYNEQFMYFFAAALIFLMLEMLLGERSPKKKLFV